uniref:Uncharacterized protein n=1 Tax=Arundo donax TaxID=35708 RepID=A0A0A9EIU8_ARUDO
MHAADAKTTAMATITALGWLLHQNLTP